MNFISLEHATFDHFIQKFDPHSIERYLPRQLFDRECGRQRQQPESVNLVDVRLGVMRIENFGAEHLIAAAYADDRRALERAPFDRIVEMLRAEPHQIVGGIFTAGQNDHIRAVKLLSRRDIRKFDIGLTGKAVEIGEI